MKKLVSLVLALCLACCMGFACAEEDGSGTWYLVDVMGMDPSAMGIEMAMILNEDGTAEIQTNMAAEDANQTGTWVKEGNQIVVTVDDTPQAFDITEDGLQADMGGGTIGTFSHEKKEAAPAPTVVAAESEEAFLGTWELSAVGLNGAVVPIAMAEGLVDVNLTFVIEAGKAVASSTSEGAAEPAEYTTEFTDGALTLSRPDPLAAITGNETETFVMELMDDGSMSYSESFGEMVLTMYMTLQETAE